MTGLCPVFLCPEFEYPDSGLRIVSNPHFMG